MRSQYFESKQPRIYAYSDSRFQGCLKIGYTERDVNVRVAEQYPVKTPEQSYRIEYQAESMREDGSLFKDFDVHQYLIKKGIERINGEWFKCDVEDVKSAVLAIRKRIENQENRTLDFAMRPEQKSAVEKTVNYFQQWKKDPEVSKKAPHFLWNAKMRFGKTFATYQLAKQMGWKRILILTFKPAVKTAWQEDLESHIDFQGWKFVTNEEQYQQHFADHHAICCFGSFQDYLGKNNAGGIKLKNEWVHAINWDCIVFDEYHFGAWRDKSKELFEQEQLEQQDMELDMPDFFDEDIIPITTDHYLYLSGTPFRALNSGEFIEEQIFNWTYSDEQKAKMEWLGENNPYLSLPRMIMLTYQLPPHIQEIALKGEFNEFDLNEFFKATGKEKEAKFKYENYVQQWLDLIRGQLKITTEDELKLGAEKPPLPFADVDLLRNLNHTFWFLPDVSSCYAMANLLAQPHNRFYQDYQVIVTAGKKAGVGANALKPVRKAMKKGLESKTITLSCGKLTTGVSVPEWTGIFMLRNLVRPETYFQAAFRVQTPWVAKAHGTDESVIIKQNCYIFDFAPDRALRQISEYCNELNTEERNPEKKIAEFVQFLPILAYDGSSMRELDAASVLDMAMSGTTATLLARRWESAVLVNVNNETLKRLQAHPQAMQALANIEGFRSLNQDIETIINKSTAVKNGKQKANDGSLTPKEKDELKENEKKERTLRKQLQEKLIKFAARIPVFMYLTEDREYALKDVIEEVEPELFYKVTGLTQNDFSLLVGLNLFNEGKMNGAVLSFKRYEDSSLGYSGLTKYDDLERVGLWSTTMSRAEYNQ
ncbi:DEAD/DEAH box helicase [Lonepinella sp. BR2357]|uniref:DEAD/DEAH box helicase n=1 Tax=Lonepinella sp. BR2357 TaxID=3434549 RepID=UPI003F6DC866